MHCVACSGTLPAPMHEQGQIPQSTPPSTQRTPRIACDRHQYQQWCAGEGARQQHSRMGAWSRGCAHIHACKHTSPLPLPLSPPLPPSHLLGSEKSTKQLHLALHLPVWGAAATPHALHTHTHMSSHEQLRAVVAPHTFHTHLSEREQLCAVATTRALHTHLSDCEQLRAVVAPHAVHALQVGHRVQGHGVLECSHLRPHMQVALLGERREG